MPKKWKLLLIVIFLATVVVWLSVFSSSQNLKVVTCNVGQGDATLIVYKSFEILIDGGPDNKVLNCLSKYIPFWDREIEIVILTHPQADHYTGLIAVIERYKVGKILANSLDSGNQSYGLLKNQVLSQGIGVVNPVSGMSIRSKMIQLDILYPTKEFLAENLSFKNSQLTTSSPSLNVLGASDGNLDPNKFSIVALLQFSSFNFLFTGDASTGILDDLALRLSKNGEEHVNYIKIPHHGSKTAISEKLYDLLKNGVATISVGKNSYGHPNEEVLRMLGDRDIKIFRTDENGDIVAETDGKKMWMK